MAYKYQVITSFESISIIPNRQNTPFVILDNVSCVDLYEQESKIQRVPFNTLKDNIIYSKGCLYKVEDKTLLNSIKEIIKDHTVHIHEKIKATSVQSKYINNWTPIISDTLLSLKDYDESNDTFENVKFESYQIPEKYFTDYKILFNDVRNYEDYENGYMTIPKMVTNMELKDKIIPPYMNVYSRFTHIDFINKQIYIPYSKKYLVAQELQKIEGEDSIIIYMGSGRTLFTSVEDYNLYDNAEEEILDELQVIFKYSSELYLKIGKNDDGELDFSNVNFIEPFPDGAYKKYDTDFTIEAVKNGSCFG